MRCRGLKIVLSWNRAIDVDVAAALDPVVVDHLTVKLPLAPSAADRLNFNLMSLPSRNA
jgi:hypothetical protein